MNRLGLFKRAAALVATPALVTLPPDWRALTPSEPSIPEPVPQPIGYTTGYLGGAAFAVPMHSHGSSPLPSNMAHTHVVFPPAHCHCWGCLGY